MKVVENPLNRYLGPSFFTIRSYPYLKLRKCSVLAFILVAIVSIGYINISPHIDAKPE